MKRVALVFILTLLLSVVFSMPTNTYAFSDIKGTVHEDNILALKEKGFVGGYPDGTYQPNTPLAREHAVRLIGRILAAQNYKMPEDYATDLRFEDVSATADDELKRLTAFLYEEGVFLGNHGYLSPQDPMQRQHMALVLVRVAQDFYGQDVVAAAKEANYRTKFKDISALDKATIDAITGLEYAGITIGDMFNPKNTVTRGEFATFLNRLLTYVDQIEPEIEVEEEITEKPSFENDSELTTNDVNSSSEEAVETDVEDEQQVIEPEVAIDFTKVDAIQIEKGAPLYASRNLLKQTGEWQSETFVMPASYLKEDDLFVMQVGGDKYYVETTYTTPANVKNNTDSKSIGTVRTQGQFDVLDAVDGQALFSGTRSTKFHVIGFEKNHYKVSLNGLVGYVPSKETFVNVKKNIKLLSNAVVFEQATSKQVATLPQHTNLKVSSVNGQRVYFHGNYYIENVAVVETNDYLTFLNSPTVVYPVKLYAETNATVYGASKEVLGTISAGAAIQLKGIWDGKGIIDFLGKGAYIDLSQFKHDSIVTPNRNISYPEVDYYVKVFNLLYPEFTELELIGQSVEGRNIHALKVGTGQKMILMDASTHAREHMTTNVLMEMIDTYTFAYLHNTAIGSYNVNQVLSNVSIWFVPMVNPDGVTLVQYGPSAVKNPELVKQINNYSSDFGRWKSNVRGVDLNRNFDARWAGLKAGGPSWDMAKGPTPFSEPESKALANFMVKYPFKSNFAIHSSGQVIFWGHNDQNKERNTNLARIMSRTTGHSLIKSSQTAPTGASTSYFSKVTGMPGMTIEIAPYAGNAPVPLHRWNDVWYRMHLVGLAGAVEANGR